ncbi:MAG: hypothetical protein COB85_07965 [Bacteroidetes bacterium]|nr:MAG: hypothetical protein COB85_07965 [Bacteroidota bacterium]
MKNMSENIEEFSKEALSDYEVSYNPGDWKEMNEKLDQVAQATNSASTDAGLLKNPVARLALGALVVATGAYFMIADQNESISVGEDSTSEKESIFERITSSQNIDFDLKYPIEKQVDIPKSNSKDTPKEEVTDKSYYNGERIKTGSKNDLNDSQNYIAKKYDGPYLEMLRNSYNNDEKLMPPPDADFTTDVVEGCSPLTVRFMADNKDVALTYLWTFGDGAISHEDNPVYTYPADGNFDVQLTVTSSIDEQSETILKKGLVSVHSSPEVSINGIDTEKDEAVVGNEVGFIESSKDVVEWQWFFGDEESSDMQNPFHSYSQPGQYSVVLVGKNSYGCLDTAVSTIFIMGKDLSIRIFPPNAFSPDGDGLNDVFLPVISGSEVFKYELTIYDRLGNLVFETDDINQGWDGTLKDGKAIATTKVFIWVITIEDEYGNKQRRPGNVTLRR